MSILINISGSRPSSARVSRVVCRDPFQAFAASGGPSGQIVQEASAVASTRIEWKETPEALVFKADLPGLEEEEVKMKIELQDGQRILQISADHSKEEEHKDDKWHRIEHSREKFLRRFLLPESAKADEITKSLEDGVLTVTVPKQPEPQAAQPGSI